ncbi:MAG: hypothetical protein OSJ65_01890 [Bacilli bacterium]|nr:hypothetical protein [Bacilli bacterium]
MDNILPKENFFVCDTSMFELDNDTVYYVDLDMEDKRRLAIFVDGVFIDVKTGDQIRNKTDEENVQEDTIFENTRYVEMVYNINGELTDELYEAGQKTYREYLTKKKLVAEKKLIIFPQKKLY